MIVADKLGDMMYITPYYYDYYDYCALNIWKENGYR